MRRSEKATLFQRLKKGMDESIAHSRGELKLKTTQAAIPPVTAVGGSPGSSDASNATTSRDYENISPYEQIKTGLEDAIAHARGELPLKTRTARLSKNRKRR